MATLNRKVQTLIEDQDKSEDKTKIAVAKCEQASQACDESERMRKMLEHRAATDNERMKGLEIQLKDARNTAEEADHKYDEVSKKLAEVEDDLERAEERAQTGEAKIMELDEELKVRFVQRPYLVLLPPLLISPFQTCRSFPIT